MGGIYLTCAVHERIRVRMETTDHLSDYRAAQAAGHHEDCDGYRTAHRVTIERDGSMRRAVCEDCGPLHAGLFGAAVPVEAMFAGHTHETACDGRCREWPAAA